MRNLNGLRRAADRLASRLPARQPALLYWLSEDELDQCIDVYSRAAEAERALSADEQARLAAIASDARARRGWRH